MHKSKVKYAGFACIYIAFLHEKNCFSIIQEIIYRLISFYIDHSAPSKYDVSLYNTFIIKNGDICTPIWHTFVLYDPQSHFERRNN